METASAHIVTVICFNDLENSLFESLHYSRATISSNALIEYLLSVNRQYHYRSLCPLPNQKPLNLIKHTPPTPLTRPPHPLPKNIKHKRHRNQQRRKPPRNTTRGPDPNIMIQRANNQRKRAGETTPQERVSRNSRRRVLRKRINEVIQRGLENREKASPHHNEPDAR